MPLPPKLDASVRQRFDELITEAEELIPVIRREKDAFAQRLKPGEFYEGEFHNQHEKLFSITTRVVTLVELVLGKNDRGQKLIKHI